MIKGSVNALIFWSVAYPSAPQPFLNHGTLINHAKLDGTLKCTRNIKNNMIYDTRTSMRYFCLFK